MKIKVLIGIMLMSIALVGCGKSQEEISQSIAVENVTQNITFNLSKTPENLDPQLNSEGEGSLIMNHVYEGLMRQVGDELINGIAESYTVSEDGLTYTFALRECYWSDGSELTAKDFEYAWRRGADPVTGSPHLKDYENAKIKNAGAIARGEMSTAALGVLALDTHVLEVTLEEPNDAFLDELALESFMPVCEESVGADGKWSKTNAVYNGPFKAASFNEEGISLEKNENYWDAKHVNLQKVDIKVVDDTETAESKYLKNELDLLISKVSCIDTNNLVLTPKEATEEDKAEEKVEEKKDADEVDQAEEVQEETDAAQEETASVESLTAEEEEKVAEGQVIAHSWVNSWRTNLQGLIWLGNAYVEEH